MQRSSNKNRLVILRFVRRKVQEGNSAHALFAGRRIPVFPIKKGCLFGMALFCTQNQGKEGILRDLFQEGVVI